MFKKVVIFFVLFFLLVTPVLAQEISEFPADEFFRGRVVEILKEGREVDEFAPIAEQYSQTVKVELSSGSDQGSLVETTHFVSSQNDPNVLKVGDPVLVIKSYGLETANYYIADRYRIPRLFYLGIAFLLLIIVVAGWTGLRSVVGLAFSILVIVAYILPSILAGQNVFLVGLLGTSVIAVVSIYLSHGFKKRTSLALLSTIVTISLSILLSFLAVKYSFLFGLGSEEALYLQIGQTTTLNLRGLLLTGIIIGLLGVLDDITTAQTAVVDELKKANPNLVFKDLYTRAYSVGKEHIASLINTLALAYVGVSLPLLLLFNQSSKPILVILNSELIAEEVVRTLIGSGALILAVPITTLIATYFYTKKDSLSKSQKID